MYKSYKVYAGQYTGSGYETVDDVLARVNSRGEEIISVTAVGEGSHYVLIITKESEQ